MANNYRGPKKPYQFEIPEELHSLAMQKARDNGVTIAPFMVMALTDFVELPIEDSQRKLRIHHEGKRPSIKIVRGK